jgi:hypothetical protein
MTATFCSSAWMYVSASAVQQVSRCVRLLNAPACAERHSQQRRAAAAPSASSLVSSRCTCASAPAIAPPAEERYECRDSDLLPIFGCTGLTS